MTTTPLGVSARVVRDQFGKSFESAWYVLHRVRRAMGEANMASYPMPGPVEVDEVFLGGPQPGVVGRGALGKQLVLVVVGRKAKHGRVWMEPIEHADAVTINPILQRVVRPGATVITDGLTAYLKVKTLGYKHQRYPVSRLNVKAHEVLPAVHGIASQFKAQWLATWKGAISEEQLPWYIAEYCFKYNRRHYKHKGRIFYDATPLFCPVRRCSNPPVLSIQ